MFIHRESTETPRRGDGEGHRDQVNVIIAKQRNGPTGDVKLAWFDKYTRFENLSQKPYEELSQPEEDYEPRSNF